MRISHALAAFALFVAAGCSSDSIAAPEETRIAPSSPPSAALATLEGIVMVDAEGTLPGVRLQTLDAVVALEGEVAGIERYAGREVVVMGWHVAELRFHVEEFHQSEPSDSDPFGREREAI